MGSDAGEPPVGKRRPALKKSVATATVTAPSALPKNIHLGKWAGPLPDNSQEILLFFCWNPSAIIPQALATLYSILIFHAFPYV